MRTYGTDGDIEIKSNVWESLHRIENGTDDLLRVSRVHIKCKRHVGFIYMVYIYISKQSKKKLNLIR